VAVALGLQERGHRPVIATGVYHRERVEAAGIEFAPVGPVFPGGAELKRLVRDVMDMQSGPETVIRRVVLPHLRESYIDLLSASSRADLLITHPLTYAGPIVADKLHLLWASSVLQPSALVSAFDEIEWAPAPWLTNLRHIAPPLYRLVFGQMMRLISSWAKPVHALRRSEGLPPARPNPLLHGGHSPYLVLAMFSKLLCAPMPDWPQNTKVTGFPFYDEDTPGRSLDPKIESFLNAGAPPIVFTLGSSAVMDAGEFYLVSAKAARKFGSRAILLVGDEPDNIPAGLPPQEVGVFAYAPYAALFPRCSAIVHQGGVGTTGQAMRSGRPMLVMPYGQDQPDNAARVVRLGIARTIRRDRYTEESAFRELRALMSDPKYSERAEKVGATVRAEDGVASACVEIEALLERGFSSNG
jgi:UDP:flavonoid glycosyltransferase YjiC (YdhE family)